jgi:hypothetical protein
LAWEALLNGYAQRAVVDIPYAQSEMAHCPEFGVAGRDISFGAF